VSNIASLLAAGPASTATPAFVIVVPIEGDVHVYTHASNEAEERRLYDWVESRPRLAELLGQAIAARRDWRSA
jgi:hypothetical protein